MSQNDETFLSQVPVALLKENILTQFNDPEHFRMDYMASFINSFTYSKEFIENDDEMEALRTVHDEFMFFMKDTLTEKLGVGINDFGEMGYDEQEELIHFTYRFFIIRLKQNFFNLFYNYICENKDALVGVSSFRRKKDITSQAFKKEIGDDDTIILANLPDIMHYIIYEANLTIDDFLRLCEGEESSTELTLVTKYFDDFILTGNFIERYARMLRISMRIRIEGDIRNRILKKYREQNPILNQDDIINKI